MLINSFFSIINHPENDICISDEKPIEFSVGVKVNSDHEIFRGHFPDQPIVPGVTYIEMIREILNQLLKSSLKLKEASNIKFLSITNPEINPELNFNFNLILKETNLIAAKVTVSSKNSSVIKFDGKFLF